MTKRKKTIDLINYKHNRENFYKSTSDEIFSLINDYSDQKNLTALYNYFERYYKLPEYVVKQKIKHHIAISYKFKSGEFNSKLRITNIPKSVLHYGVLIFALFFTKKKKDVNFYKLIIDDIYSSEDLKRFEKLLNLVGKDNVLCVTKNINITKDFQEYNFYNKKLFRDLGLKDVLKSIISEFFIGIWVVLKASIKTRVNLFPVSLQIIHSYLSCKALFESNNAEYIIQDRHYDTNSVKNYLFKSCGGIASTTIQKNIFQYDPMFYYMDIDIFYTLGDSGYENFIDYGARIEKIRPIGSFFMESYWFQDSSPNLKNRFDVVFLGINLADRMDSYNEFLDDYYSSFRWLVKLKRDNPTYRISIIHHTSLKIEDQLEKTILFESGIEILDKSLNSYDAAFSAFCAVTYGSTMGYELNAHDLPTFFIDPGNRCSFLPLENSSYLNNLRLGSYKDFSKSINKILSDKESSFLTTEQKSNLCLDSVSVSDKIFNYFQDNNTK